jgi:cyanophycin synthetase
MKKKEIEFLDVVTLRGPNIWTYRPVLEAWVDIGELEEFPSNLLPGFTDRLVAWLPTLIEHRCSPGVRGGFLMRLREGTWAGHILEHVTLELQNLAGLPGGFGKARETSTRGVYKVIVRAWQETVTRAALHAARDLLMAAIEDRPYDVGATVASLRDLVDTHCLGPSTACIVDAADDRDIPYIRLFDGNLVQFGYGSRQRRIWTAETELTSAIAEGISRDKSLTKSLLASCGVPVPEGRLVENRADAWDAAVDIGLPVVIKPEDGNHGRGVFTNLVSREEIEAAYDVAVEEGSGVIVERFVLGNEHRLLVVGGKLVAAARGEPAGIVGDGVHTVVELIELQINSDPRRGSDEDCPLNPVRLDSAARLEVARQGLSAEAIPAQGLEVLIQRSGNVAFDVTDQVHPQVAAMVALAARIVGLDIAGVDLVAQDISRPLAEQRGAIVEVNAGPGLLMHLKPAEGEPRPVGRAVADHLFPEGDDGRIPVIGVAGTNGKTVVARLLGHLLQLAGTPTGVACSDGLYVDRKRVESGDCANWHSGRRLLMNRVVDAAIIENDSHVILGQGLAYDRCQVGVITNIDAPDHLGDFDILDAERMFNVLRTQVDVVLPTGCAVLNARDQQVVEMATLCDGEVIFFGIDPKLPAISSHLALHKRAVFVRGGKIVLAQGRDETALCLLRNIPLTRAGNVRFQTENVLAAIAAAWALGLAPAMMRAGVQSLGSDPADAPWPFTVFERAGITVIIDGAHNESALAAAIAAVRQFPAERATAVYGSAADRRDEDLHRQGQLLGEAFDRIVLVDDVSVASRRAPGTARAQLAAGAASGTRCTDIVETADHVQAVEQALARAGSGDLLFLQSGEGGSQPIFAAVNRWLSQI